MDDVDIGLRGRLAGWSCVYVPEAVVYHKYSATTQPFSPLKAFLLERNRIWVVLKYFPPAMCGASLFYTSLRYAMQAYGALTGRGAGSRLVQSGSLWQAAGVLCRAHVAALRGAGRMLGKRRAMRRLRKISAGEFSGYFRRFGIGVGELSLKE
jgi:GT2 family glycosyltransferase